MPKRHLALALPLSVALLAPQPVRAETPPAAAATAPAPGPRATSTALAVAIEALSPIGAAGCFYRRRPLIGGIVAAASLISGGLMLHGLARGNGDEVSLNAFAFGVSRFIGIVTAATPDAAPPPPLPAPRAAALPPFPATTIGLAHAFSF